MNSPLHGNFLEFKLANSAIKMSFKPLPLVRCFRQRCAKEVFIPSLFAGEWKVETPYGFAVADAHVNLGSVDDFVINVNFDSDKIKHRKIHAEIANNPTAKTGRRIVITVTSEGKNIVTGRYRARSERKKKKKIRIRVFSKPVATIVNARDILYTKKTKNRCDQREREKNETLQTGLYAVRFVNVFH